MGTLNERPLHAALKAWYAQPGDLLESSVDGFVIDIVRGDLLVEIQTGNFSAIRRKLAKLTIHHRVRLVYPVARDKWIVRLSDDACIPLGRRRSPKRGAVEDLFEELVRFPDLTINPNFSIELLLIREEEIRRRDAVQGWRRRGWVICERRLLEVLERSLFRGPSDIAALIPPSLAEPFSTSDLARAVGRPRRLAQKMVYCLRRAGCITQSGKSGNSILYSREMTRPVSDRPPPVRTTGSGKNIPARS